MVAPSTPTSRRSCRLLQVKSSSSVSAYVARDLAVTIARALKNVLKSRLEFGIHVPKLGWSISWGGSVELTTYITLSSGFDVSLTRWRSSTQDMELAMSRLAGLVLQPIDSSQVWWWFVATDSLSEPWRNQRSDVVWLDGWTCEDPYWKRHCMGHVMSKILAWPLMILKHPSPLTLPTSLRFFKTMAYYGTKVGRKWQFSSTSCHHDL